MKQNASLSIINRFFSAGYLIGELKAIILAFTCVLAAGCSTRTIDVLIGGPREIHTDLQVFDAAPTRTFRPGIAIANDAVDITPSALPQVAAALLKRHPAHDGPINDLVVSADGNRVFSGGDDGKVVLSELGQTKERGGLVSTQIILQGQSPILALALSRDERYLAVSRTASVLIFDRRGKRFTNELSLIKGRITALTWDPLGEYLALGRSNGDVFCWKVRGAAGAGRNSAEELEEYLGAKSPIVSIRFHPSGRAFFAAESSGIVSFWRLLRTEEQIGLRDEFSVKDLSLRAREREKIVIGGSVISSAAISDSDAAVSDSDPGLVTDTEDTAASEYLAGAARIEDLWLSPDGDLLSVAADNGAVFPIKVRGLVAGAGAKAADGRIRSISGVLLNKTGGSALVLAISQRVNRLKFLCASGEALRVVGETELLKNSLGVIRAAERAPTLWVAEKTGNLLRFDMRLLGEQREIAASLVSCGA